MIEVFAPVATTNALNGSHGHWRVRQKRAKQTRAVVTMLLDSQPVKRETMTLPCVVKLCRHSAGIMDDDGLASSLKSSRDAVAKWIGVDDRHRHIVRYVYEQKRVKRGEPKGVQITIIPAAEVHEEIRRAGGAK